MSELTTNEDDDDLDVSLSVFETPIDPLFPRRPNVVSRRRHQLEIEVTVNRLPEGAGLISISADVVELGPERLGHQEHKFRPIRRWGSNPGQEFEVDPDELPATFKLIVSKIPGDDHLGQGPYDAYVTVSLGDSPETDSAGGIPVITNRTFGIRFDSM
ncbi:MAG TPA: hypothetical protein VF544_07650 [Pyrinomonadaceae bacterium]|jgi:hypothetical protein